MTGRHLCLAVAGAALLPLFSSLAAVPADAAQGVLADGALTYNWEGDRMDPRADNHSWTDRRNWSPKGVPGDGDAVNIVSPFSGPCNIHIDAVPTGLTLSNLLLSTSIKEGCKASIAGGSIAIAATFLWTGGTVNTPITVNDGAGALIGDEGPVVKERLGQQMEVLGGLQIRAMHMHMSPTANLTFGQGSNIWISGTSEITGPACCHSARVVNQGEISFLGSTLSVDSVAFDQHGQLEIDADSELALSGRARGSLAPGSLTGGGTFSVAAPMDVGNVLSFEDNSVLRLLPGGTLDGSAVYTGDGSFEWLGGELSGNDVAFALNDMTVGGRSTKSIRDDAGQTSFVQVVNPVTFTPGTKAEPNLLDMNGNSFQSFAACTVQGNVELRDGDFVSSVGAIVFAAGADRTIVSDSDVQIFSSGPLTVASGTLVSRGALLLNAGDVDIRDAATMRLPDPSHPLMLQGGSLTGVGTVDGDIVNSAGVFDPLDSGASDPLTVHGSYVQSGGGRLVLDIGADSVPLVVDGGVAVAGIVTYNNLVGYSPGFGDERTLLTAGSTLDWTPGCEETTGSRAQHGHWVGSAVAEDVTATFTRHPSGTC